jgi:hypothetical protein
VDRRLAALACSQSDRAVEGALAGCGERRGAGGSAKGKESDGEDECMARGGREDGGEGAGSGSGEQVQEVVHGRKEAGAGGGQEAGAEGRREEEVQHKEGRETSRETEREREEEARLYRRAAAITGESATHIGIFFFILSCRSHHRRICCCIGRCSCFHPLSLYFLLSAPFLSPSLPYPDAPSVHRTPFCLPACKHMLSHPLTRTHTQTHTHTYCRKDSTATGRSGVDQVWSPSLATKKIEVERDRETERKPETERDTQSSERYRDK